MLLRDLMDGEGEVSSAILDWQLKKVRLEFKTQVAHFLFVSDEGKWTDAEQEQIREQLQKKFGLRITLEVESIAKGQEGEQPDPQPRPTYEEPVVLQPPRQKKRQERSEDQNGETIGRFGKNEPTYELNEVSPDLNTVVVEGIVCAVESTATKTGSLILRFDLEDYEGGALCAKLFCNARDTELALKMIHEGAHCRVRGRLQYDSFSQGMMFMAQAVAPTALPEPEDPEPVKRVEIAVHTQMTNMEGTIECRDLVKRLAAWGQDAVGIADTGSLQAYPLIAQAASGSTLRILYGYQAKRLRESHRILSNPFQIPLADDVSSFTVFDLETTGFSRYLDQVIEIGAVRYENGEKIGEFSEFVNPGRAIPERITELTSITDAMVAGADPIEKVLPRFIDFAKGSILVAHNAEFDVGFVRENAHRMGIDFRPVWMDTLGLARCLHPEFKNHKLDTLTKELHVPLFHHHRAIDDATATGFAFLALWKEWKAKQISLHEINETPSDFPLARHESSELLVYCPKKSGLKPFYDLVSQANIHYFDHGRPGVPESILEERRTHFLIGSGMIGSELFRLIAEDLPESLQEEEARQMDFLVVQPDTFTETALRRELVADVEHFRRITRRLIALGQKLNLPVIATGMPTYLNHGDRLARNILVNYQRNVDFDENGRYCLMNTREMLDAFSWLPSDVAHHIVIDTSREFADQFESYPPVPHETTAPELEGAAEELRESSISRAQAIYGSPLPELVQKRLDRELNSIIGNGYSSLYVIARRLVMKSNADGYLVGSRGSVGSSFVATMSGITEVNPLVPHYVCPSCQHSEFIEDGSVESGFDLPRKVCPVCGMEMNRDGHTIPFEVFLGFNGDKEPDIDLNFAGEYMPTIHKYTEELFGEGKVFRAGTISGVQSKTAYGLIRKYQEQPYIPSEDHNLSEAHIRQLQRIMEGTKRTTGQHPGGLMIVPKQMDITDATPIQYPADDVRAEAKTTHFSYNNLGHCLLKLDELGQSTPTIIRQLGDMTGIDPLEIAFDDPETMAIFSAHGGLPSQQPYTDQDEASLGIPEFGTPFVRGMLKDTHPSTFGELCRISGLSHGTNVWLNNAQDLIRQGKTTLQGATCTRDDIMIYLISMGLDNLESFKTMEAVRKGKGIPESVLPHMREHNVPEWYIDSCQRISYLFPKAHATAYVMMSYRIAWFKVHQPAAFYATYFTQHLSDFSSVFLRASLADATAQVLELRQQKEARVKIDEGKLSLWEIVEEMLARGLSFSPVSMEKSEAVSFQMDGSDRVLPPFAALDAVSEANGCAIVAAREKGPFLSRTDLRKKTGLPKAAMESLLSQGLLDDLTESNQMSFFPGF